jgi:hypothetical protein
MNSTSIEGFRFGSPVRLTDDTKAVRLAVACEAEWPNGPEEGLRARLIEIRNEWGDGTIPAVAVNESHRITLRGNELIDRRTR